MPVTGFFRLRELEGPGAATLTLTGPAAALAGPSLEGEARGGAFVALGSVEALLTVSGVAPGQTDFSFAWSAANLRPSHVTASGIDAVARPESLKEAFFTLKARGRVCLVDLPGGRARRGVVRKVSEKPGRGYARDPATGAPLQGADCEVTVTFAWAGSGEAPAAPDGAFETGEQLAGDLGDGLDAIGSAAADAAPFDRGFLEQLDDATNNVRSAGANLRALLRGKGPLGSLPADLARQVRASARALGTELSRLDAVLSDTPDVYQAAGTSFADVVRGRAASGEIKGATFDLMARIADLFAALDARSPRSVRVRPGQSLAQVSAAEFGDRNRWPEIATYNGLAGQFVPDGVFSVELPGES
jgi:hypothetical protein